MRLKEGDELPKKEISPAAWRLAEALHHEARTERILTIIELALREATYDALHEKTLHELLYGYSINHWKDETPNPNRECNSDLDVSPTS